MEEGAEANRLASAGDLASRWNRASVKNFPGFCRGGKTIPLEGVDTKSYCGQNSTARLRAFLFLLELKQKLVNEENVMGDKVLIPDEGGRGVEIARTLAKSSEVEQVFLAPGPGGGIRHDKIICVPIPLPNTKDLVRFAKENGVALVVPGSEIPFAFGLYEQCRLYRLRIFASGPKVTALESSKIEGKQFCRIHDIPTGQWAWFKNPKDARCYIYDAQYPLVIKTDGLAGGKGAEICQNVLEAERAIEERMVRLVHGESGKRIVIERYLGPTENELSGHALCWGEGAEMMVMSKDQKIYKGMTGGVFAFAPVPWVTASEFSAIEHHIMRRTVRSLRQKNKPLIGFLYPGLMRTSQGPKVLEINICRGGDPESQAIFEILADDYDLYHALQSCVDRRPPEPLRWKKKYAACLVMLSGGYPDPGKMRFGFPIAGIEEAEREVGVTILPAGVEENNEVLFTAKGRVLNILATADDLLGAIKLTYEAAEIISYEGKDYDPRISEVVKDKMRQAGA